MQNNGLNLITSICKINSRVSKLTYYFRDFFVVPGSSFYNKKSTENQIRIISACAIQSQNMYCLPILTLDLPYMHEYNYTGVAQYI